MRNLELGLFLMVFGMLMVFVILCLLSLAVNMINYILNTLATVRNNRNDVKLREAPEQAGTHTIRAGHEVASFVSPQLIAAISGALAVHLQKDLGEFVVGRVRPVAVGEGASLPWARVGRLEQMSSRKRLLERKGSRSR